MTSTELQKNTREVINWARTRGEAAVIETYGKPMAALLSYNEYQAYQQYRQARAARSTRLREAEAQALVDEERQALFTEKQQHQE